MDNYKAYKQSQVEHEPEVENVKISKIFTGEIYKNSSLYTELLKQEVPKKAVARITNKFSELFDLTSSHPGDKFKLFMAPGDTVLAFEYITHDLQKYRLERVDDEYVEKVSKVELNRRIDFISAVVETSLWEALIEKIPEAELFTRVTDIYSWEIDFYTESRAGDKIKIVFESLYKDNEFVKCSDILAAEYTLNGTPHRAFLYTDPDGYSDYYDENGYSLRRELLKSPLNYRRISSRYSQSRLHPIFKIYRPHLGVDYAAAKGTPVVSAGDGMVKIKSWVNGFGNYIEVEHDYGISTGYGHLSAFAKGVVNGRRVRQGQVIGYVGQTGIATGPHLDYRVKKNGRYINPLKMTVPAALPVNPKYLDDFKQTVSLRMNYLDRHIDRKLYVMNQ